MDTVKYTLPETAIPKSYYNIIADLPTPPPPALHPGTGQPIGPDDLAPLFPMALIMQEVSTEQYIEIPDPVRAIYRQWRPTPLFRARRLEALLDTPAHIYYKYEGVSPVGSHKPNTAVPQAFYNKEEGIKHLAHRNRGRSMGIGTGLRRSDDGPGGGGVHGEGQLPAEALPPGHDGDFRRQGLRQPHHPHPIGV